MNNYAAMAAAYRQMEEQGKLPHDVAAAEIRIYDFLGTCDEDDLCRIADSGALNDIIRAYLAIALDWSAADHKTAGDVQEQLKGVLDQYQAREVLDIWRGKK
jgi:hypothetical protein